VIDLIDNINMGELYNSDWLAMRHERVEDLRRRVRARSVQIWWTDAIGIYNGRIDIYATNDFETQSLMKTIYIQNSTNMDDFELLIFDNNFDYLKINYINNGIQAGMLNLSIFYD